MREFDGTVNVWPCGSLKRNLGYFRSLWLWEYSLAGEVYPLPIVGAPKISEIRGSNVASVATAGQRGQGGRGNLARKVVAVEAAVTLVAAVVVQELMVLAVGVDVATLTRALYLMKNIHSPPGKHLPQKNLWPRG